LAALAAAVVLLLGAAAAAMFVPWDGDNPDRAAADPSHSTSRDGSSGSSTSKSKDPHDSTSDKPKSKSHNKTEPDPDPGGYAAIASANSGRCIGVAGESQKSGDWVIQWGIAAETGCSKPHEHWSWASGYGEDGSDFKIVNQNSGMCLDLDGTSSGAKLIQRACRDSHGSQVWDRTYSDTKNGWDYFAGLRNSATGLCLDNQQKQDEDNVVIIVRHCLKDDNGQMFRIPA
ncbi:MAG TPA: RICIN domain-containing protein, partial [Stackebrandtia sp.]|uniref:RICIN domain-containing protein n=1 Tax=Stackebrandtia sp. TaxID=2023065 RepID=UPI002D35F1D3